MDRPGFPSRICTTPAVAGLIELLGGGLTQGSVTVSRDEYRHLQRLYDFVEEGPNERPPPPEPPVLLGLRPWEQDKAREEHKRSMESWNRWRDPRVLLQAGSDRNLMRHAEADGLRLVAFLARFCERGQDPMKVLIQMAVEAGYDLDPEDIEWASNDDADQPTDEEAAPAP